AGPSFLLRIPPDPFFLFAPWLAIGVGGSTIVHDAPIGGPGPTPLQVRAGLAGGVGRAPVGGIFSHPWVDARLEPQRTGRRTIILQCAEACKVLIRIGTLKAVELF